MAMEWHALPANYLDFQRELEETRNGFQMVKNFITDLVQVEDQYTSRLTYLTEKHTKCIFNSNVMAAASNSILTSQAYKNLERSNLTMISTSETIVINKQYVKTVEEQIRPKIQDLEDHLVSETAVLNGYIQTADKSLKSFKKDREAADAKYTSAKRKAERKESQKGSSVKSRLKSSFSTKDQDSKHKEKIAIMKMHQEEMLKANDEYNLQLKKQFDTVFPEIIKKQEALYRTSLELFYGTFQEFESAHKTRDGAITDRQCKIAVSFAPKTEAVQKSSENVFVSVQKSKRLQPTPFPTAKTTSTNQHESSSSISSEHDIKNEDKDKPEDSNEEVFDNSKCSNESPEISPKRSTFEELHSQAVETRPPEEKDDNDDSFSENSEEESGKDSSGFQFDLDELEKAESAKTENAITQQKNDNDHDPEQKEESDEVNIGTEDSEDNSSPNCDDKTAASQVEELLKALKDGTSSTETVELEESPKELILRRFRVKFDFDSADYGEEFLTITEGDEVEAEISADWIDEDGWIAVKKGDKIGAVPYDYLESMDK